MVADPQKTGRESFIGGDPSAEALARDFTSEDAPPLFFYGSLRDPDLLATVIGRDTLAGVSLTPARLRNARVGRVAGESFPMVFDAPGENAIGVLAAGLTTEERARVAFFEDSDYAASLVEVELEAGDAPSSFGRTHALLFRPTDKLRDSGEAWDLDHWAREEKALLIACAEEQLSYFGKAPQSIVELWWPDIKARAEARLGIAPPSPLSPFGRSDVEEIERREPYRAFFHVTEAALRWRAFAGDLGPVQRRAAFGIGPVTTVLPYDARRDEVVLIEQFRAGPYMADDTRPWIIETVAGRLEPAETPEASARREAMEEAGVTLGRTERIAAFYSSPGATDEFVYAFLGEADLASAGGVHGLDAEGEDIRVVRTGFWDAMTMMARGDIISAPALLSLHWLARNRDRLQCVWSET